MNKKLIPVAVLLAGALTLLMSCGSGKDGSTESTGSSEISGLGNKEKSAYDGIWIPAFRSMYDFIDYFEEPYALSISDNSAEIYSYDLDSAEYFPLAELEDGKNAEVSFDCETGTLTVTVTYDNDGGEREPENYTYIMEADGVTATIRENGEGWPYPLCRVDENADRPEMLSPKEGVWYTEDRNYGFVCRTNHYTYAVLAQLSTDGDLPADWYNEGDHVEYAFAMYAIVLPKCMVCVVSDIDLEYKFAAFDCTLENDRLTISGLDKVKIASFDRESEIDFPISELTFVYDGETDD